MNSRLNFPFASRTRPLGLGGTDIGAILGLSPYKTPLELWSELVSGEQPASRDLIHLRFGQHAESFIASEYERATDLFTAEHSPTLFHKKNGFMFGHIDRFVLETPDTPAVVDGTITADKLLECKTSSAFSKNDWGEPGTDQVPPLYLVQCAWYMAITECQSADLAVLIGNSDFRVYTIEREMELEGLILSHAQHFWHEHVLKDIPPPAQSPEDCQLLFQHSDPSKTLEANPETLTFLERLQTLNYQGNACEEEITTLKTQIMAQMQDAEVLAHQGQVLATWKAPKASYRLDAKRLEAEERAIYEKYKVASQVSRRFVLKDTSQARTTSH